MDQSETTRLLLVDDEAALREPLAEYLARQGFVVEQAASAAEARVHLRDAPPDLVLLDIMMPGEDGLSLCRHLAETQSIPTILLTARGEATDRIVGLEIGADDYVTKPFEPKELSARIRALLRRARPAASGHAQLVFGDLEIVPEEGKVLVDGRPVAVTKTEFRLLLELAHDPGAVVSRERLLETVWGYGYFGDSRLVDVHVRRLRTKIERDPAEPRHVVTVRGMGYRLES